MLPLRGGGAAYTDVQGRELGDNTSPAGLADLISSIAQVGVLQAVLVEETQRPDGTTMRLLVAGERRYRAARWGAAHLPGNPHFAEIPAIVCPGPLSEEERRIWQLCENLAREALQPGELAAALLLERCAVLAAHLADAGIPIPDHLLTHPDPATRFRGLDALRGDEVMLAAPWSLVLDRLGLQLSPRKARQLVAAFRQLPAELSAEMDEQKIALHTRIRFAQLRRGRADAADEIWAAIKEQQRPELLPAAVTASLAAPQLSAEEVVAAADAVRRDANAARAAKLTHATSQPTACPTTPLEPASRPDNANPQADQPAGPAVADTTSVLAGLRELLADLRGGAALSEYDAGSLRLLLDELQSLIMSRTTTDIEGSDR